MKALEKALNDYTQNKRGSVNPTVDKEKMIDQILRALADAKQLLTDHNFSLDELVTAEGFKKMELLADAKPTVGGEIQLTDALDAVLAEEEMYALIVDPTDGFDTGTVESWLDTNNVLYKRAHG